MDKVSRVLEAALVLLGPTGENWARGCKDNDKYCPMTAIWDAAQSRIYRDDNVVGEAILRLQTASNLSDIGIWNDAKLRSWTDVRELFDRALGMEMA